MSAPGVSLPDRDPPEDLTAGLAAIVGRRFVATGRRATRRFRKGYRCGEGEVAAVVRPGSLVELWRVLERVTRAGGIVIMQAANTGLTGGSTPDAGPYDRPVFVVNTMRLRGVRLIRDGRQAVCLPGATLDQLERQLRPLGREPHSVIGSSCIGASVLGGICNNSGGALVRRGPAYTEMALYARFDGEAGLTLVNHLGIDLGTDVERALLRLETGDYADADVDDGAGRTGSDHAYADHVRRVDEPTPARFNADPARLFEASGSAGKLAVFAVRLDTFPAERTRTFYIGSNDPQDLTAVRRAVLQREGRLPIAGEYIHRDAFDVGARYGKDVFLLIDRFGTQRVPAAFALKSRIDGWFETIGLRGVTDRVLQAVTALLPDHLPARIRAWRDRYEHHLLLKVSEDDAGDVERLLENTLGSKGGACFACTDEEARKAFLHRFAIASAAIRYRDTHRRSVEDIVALDIALRRNDRDWVERLPADIEDRLVLKLYYGHFLCHVFHQDYIVRKGCDPIELEHRMWALLDARGAEYPAEHNVGHLYPAKPSLAAFYRELDPCNVFNPGIGHTPRRAHWRADGGAGPQSGCGHATSAANDAGSIPSEYLGRPAPK